MRVVRALTSVATVVFLATTGLSASAADRATEHPPEAARPGADLATTPCPDAPEFQCGSIRVPLDHDRRHGRKVTLGVAMTDNPDAPRGVLLMLAGGPGQPGVSLIKSVSSRYLSPAVRAAYQVVMLDQRGTGAGAIDCPELQEAVGGSDFLTPPASSVRACSDQLGRDRDHYSTSDTVEDLEELRRALGVRRMAVDGVSYGTFVGEHYGLRYPHRVSKLVLDSVVPQTGFDPFEVATMQATRRVLRDACADDPACTSDPVADLAWVLRHGLIDGRPINGTRLLESLAVLSLVSVDPTFTGIPGLLHAAREGDTTGLARFLDLANSLGTAPDQLSAGLHMATLCTDLRFPWGDADSSPAGRAEAVRRALARRSPAEFWPYDKATARASLPIAGCQAWGRAEPGDAPRRKLTVPTLLLAGERDLFCPMSWAQEQRRRTPRGRLVVVENGGHGLQASATDPTARDAATTFLLD